MTSPATVTVFMVDGTHELLDWLTGGVIAFPDNPLIATTIPALIDTTTCTIVNIDYPASAIPMGTSVQQGLSTLTSAIKACTGLFILCGYSQGAAVCSLALNELLAGSLTASAPQFLGGVTFGNLCRQPGKVAPVQTDPGGSGAWSTNQLTNTPSNWWDFALPLDAATTVPASQFGVDVQTAFDLFMGSFTGGSVLTFLATNAISAATDGFLTGCLEAMGSLVIFGLGLAQLITPPAGMISLGPHAEYPTTAPPGATLTAAQLGANRINELAAAALSGSGFPYTFPITLS